MQLFTQQSARLEVASVSPPRRYFSMQLQDCQGKTLSDVKYRLIIGESDNDPDLELFEGTSASGYIEHQYYHSAKFAVLQYWPHKNSESSVVRTVDLVALAVTNSNSGQAQRFANLGFSVENDKQTDTALTITMNAYQSEQCLDNVTSDDIACHIDSLWNDN